MTLNEAIDNRQDKEKLAARFWRKVNITDDSDGCWMWISKARHRFGYGAITIATGHVQTAHRVAWALKNGPIPEGAYITHKCDNPACCNPKHLELGNATSNMADKVARGRQSRVRHSQELIAHIQRQRALRPMVVTEAGRAAKSAAIKARWNDPAWRERFSGLMSGERNHRFGKRPPDHQIEAVRRGHRKGFKHTEETKEKMRAAALARYRRT